MPPDWNQLWILFNGFSSNSYFTFLCRRVRQKRRQLNWNMLYHASILNTMHFALCWEVVRISSDLIDPNIEIMAGCPFNSWWNIRLFSYDMDWLGAAGVQTPVYLLQNELFLNIFLTNLVSHHNTFQGRSHFFIGAVWHINILKLYTNSSKTWWIKSE